METARPTTVPRHQMKSNRHHENLMIAPRETDALITSHRRSHMTETAPAQAAAGDALLELALSTCSSHDPRWHADIWTATTTDAINKWTLGAHQYQAAAPQIRSIMIIMVMTIVFQKATRPIMESGVTGSTLRTTTALRAMAPRLLQEENRNRGQTCSVIGKAE